MNAELKQDSQTGPDVPVARPEPYGRESAVAPATDDPGLDTRLHRLGGHARGLFDDIKSWVELRMELTQVEVEDRVEEKVNEATSGIALAAVGVVGLLFLLVAGAIALGDVLGHSAYGFLIVGAVLLIVTLILHRAKPRFIRIGKDR